MGQKTAIIFGAQGQDGQLLTEFLTSQEYLVIGVGRETTSSIDGRSLAHCDFTQEADIVALLQHVRPAEIYHLAAVHHSSEEQTGAAVPLFQLSFEINTASLMIILEAIKNHSLHTRLFYATSSHLFGNPDTEVQNEQTRMEPHSVYGITKLAGMLTCKMYRTQSHIFAATGILYNHESHLRTSKFLTKKIIQAAIAIRNGSLQKLIVGDLNAEVDWGYAPDYVRAMHAILQVDSADDYVIATGQKHTVKEFIRVAFDSLGLNWKQHTVEDRSIALRQAPVRIGDSSKLRAKTDWKPTVNFETMIQILVQAEVNQEQMRGK